MQKKNQTCCFTGHRNIPVNQYGTIQHSLEAEIICLIHQDVRYFGAGGALGFDTMAALTVLKLKPQFPHIRLILVLPCKEQTKGWRQEDVECYSRILNAADKVVYTSERYDQYCMHKRNRHLVDHSMFCISYLTDRKGGTAYTVNYAKQKGLQITSLAP